MTNNAKQPSGITRFFNRPTYNRHKNVIWILILNIVTALCQFIIYRYIIKFLGIESMGVWSLVIAATAIGQISNFGFSNGLIKYIPELIISNDKKGIQQFTGTANIANIALSAPLLVALYVPTLWFADSILTPEQLHLFKQIIPWCMLSILLNNIASVFAFLFDGFQLFFVRSMIQSAGFVVFLIVGLILASIEGLPGIAQALCCQSLFVLISYSLVARNKNLTESYFPLLFNKPAFRQLFSFGMKFQLISLLNIFLIR